MAFTEFFTNRGSCTLTSAYTAGDTSIHVSSTTGDDANYPFPVSVPFRLSLFDSSNVFKVILKVTAITDGTHFATTPEGHDANAANGSTCYGVQTAESLTAIRTDAGTVANLTGLGTNVGTFLGTPSSANLAAALTDETGTGANVFATSPTLVTPILGTPTSGALTNCTSIPVDQATGVLPGANGGGLVLLEQHTASSSASLDFTTCISSTYDEYKIELVNIVPATDNQQLLWRASTNGGSSYDSGSSYNWSASRYSTVPDAVSAGSASATSVSISGGSGVSVSTITSLSGSWTLYNPSSASLYKLLIGQSNTPFSNGASTSIISGQGTYKSATAVNAFQFLFASGNIASGTIRCYGIAKT